MVDPVLLDHVDACEEVVAAARAAGTYCFDTEFHRERTYYPQLALLQIAVGPRIWLIDPLHVRLEPLAELFRSDAIAIVHAGRQDIEIFEHRLGCSPTHVQDTQIIAGFVGYRSASLASLAESELGLRIPKGDRLTDWFRRPLSAAQRRYASADVAHLEQLRNRLMQRVDSLGRSDWVNEAINEQLARWKAPREPAEAWHRIKEIRQLKGESLVLGQALAEWRDITARKLDVPVRFVMNDVALASLASLRPESASGIQSIRGIDANAIRSEVDNILRLTTRDYSGVPPLQFETNGEVDRSLRPMIPLVTAWIGELASQLTIDPALLATRADIEAALRGVPDCRLRTGWRAEAIGMDIDKLLTGRAAVRFTPGSGLELVDLEA